MMKFCPQCGTKVMPNAKFCMECGLSLVDYERQHAEQKDDQPDNQTVEQSDKELIPITSASTQPPIKSGEEALNRGDYKTAIKYFIEGIRAGDARSMYRFAMMYRTGQGTDKDPGKAFDWMLKAAEAGDTDAMLEVSNMYRDGEGVAASPEQAAKWGIRSGNPEKIYAAGLVLYINKDKDKNLLGKALELFKAAANDGYPPALNQLGLMYFRGEGVPHDVDQARYFFKRAIEGGYEEAERNLRGLEAFVESERKAAAQKSAGGDDTNSLKKVTDFVVRNFPFQGGYFVDQNSKSDSKIKAAIAAYGGLITDDEFVIGCYDSTVFGAADEGCIFTNLGIYILSPTIDNNVRFVSYRNITSLTIRGLFIKDIYINDFKVETAGFQDADNQNFIGLINFLIKATE